MVDGITFWESRLWSVLVSANLNLLPLLQVLVASSRWGASVGVANQVDEFFVELVGRQGLSVHHNPGSPLVRGLKVLCGLCNGMHDFVALATLNAGVDGAVVQTSLLGALLGNPVGLRV